MQAAAGQPLADQALTDRLLLLLRGVPEGAAQPLTLAYALEQPAPLLRDDARIPLTW